MKDIDTRKILLPWNIADTDPTYADISNIHGYEVADVICTDRINWSYAIYDAGDYNLEEYTTRDDAVAACNLRLKALGYEIVSVERAEKLRLLL